MSSSNHSAQGSHTDSSRLVSAVIGGGLAVLAGVYLSTKSQTPLLWIPLLPFIGAAINILLGRKLSRGSVHAVGCGVVLGALGVVLGAVFGKLFPMWSKLHAAAGDWLMDTPRITNTIFQWINSGPVNIEMGFALDPLSAVMVITVTFVGSLIHIYSAGYMSHDRDYARFFGYLNLFTGSMLMLVLGDNLIVLFVGWEGVGVCSYLLIGFWYNKTGTDKEGDGNSTAGKKAFIVNRIGDFAFILGMFLLFSAAGTLNVVELSGKTNALMTSWNPFGNGMWMNVLLPGSGSLAAGMWEGAGMMLMVLVGVVILYKWRGFKRLAGLAPLLGGWAWSIFASTTLPAISPVTIAGAAAILMLIGATGKSAQIPLFVWLPDAMAGPTPVSALIHAATMVTAGVYMVARLNFIYMLSPTAMGVVALVGACTALFAATIGLAQNDIKKVLAYSTISQLGYMFLAVGVGAFAAGVFHLFTHAFFKACLFLGAGAVIHAMSGKQDIREMGGLRKKMPITHMTFLISCIAIAGIPPLAGFFSKDEILWKTIATANPAWPTWFPIVLYVIGMAAAMCTAFYMFRLYWITFSGENRADEETRNRIHEQPVSMTMPLAVLAFGATVLGVLGLPGVMGPNFFHHWLAPVVDRGAQIAAGTEGLDYVRANLLSANHGLEWGLMALSTALAVGVSYLAMRMYKDETAQPIKNIVGKIPMLHSLVFDKYRIDEIYFTFIVGPLRWIGMFLWKGVDSFFVDFLGVEGSARITDWIGNRVRRLQDGNAQRYIVGLVAGLAIIVFFSTFPMSPLRYLNPFRGSEFAITPGAKVKVGQQVHFDATRRVNVDKRNLRYQWDFGDGAQKQPPSYDPKPAGPHVYKKPGRYKVTLTVEDMRWLTTASESRTVEVLQ